MPLVQDYVCGNCGAARTVEHGARVPLCGGCRGLMTWKRTRTYQRQYDPAVFATGMRAPAIDFNQTKGRVAPIGDGIRVDSLHDIRRIERESEKRAADGVGERYIFRKYAQNASNLHTHTLGPAPDQAPSQDWLRAHQQIPAGDQTRHGDPEAQPVDLGPGTRVDLTSALPIDPGGGGTVIGE